MQDQSPCRPILNPFKLAELARQLCWLKEKETVMFNHNPYGGYGGYPQQPIVFIPTPGTPQADPLADIQQQIGRLEALKKMFKEEKKEDKDKKNDPSVFSMCLLMILVSPITGPLMSKFFSMGIGMLPHTP